MNEAPDFFKDLPGTAEWPSELSAIGYAIDEAANIAITDEKGVILRVNANFCRTCKYEPNELIGHDHRLINSGYHSRDFMSGMWNTILSGSIWKGEFKNKTKDGSFYWTDTTIVPLLNANGKPYRFIAIRYDITLRKEAEMRHRELEKKIESKGQELAHVLERIADGFLIVDNNFCYRYANKKIGEMTGRDPDSLIGKNMWEEFPDAVGGATYEGMQKAMREKVYVHNVDHYEPLNLWQENHIYPSPDGLSMFIRDVTQQKRIEQELIHRDSIYKTITSNIPGSVILIVDKALTYRLIEGDLLEKLGYDRNKMLDRNIKDVVPPERYTTLLPYFTRALNGELQTLETSLNGYDLITRFVPLRNLDQSVFSVMIVGIDITELKKAQKEVSEVNAMLEKKVTERTNQLERVNKELEAFSYSVAHDLRSPLRAVSGYSAIVNEDYGAALDEEGKRLLNAIDLNAKKMGTLIDDLLTFSRFGRKEIQLSEVNMNELIDVVIAEIRAGNTQIPLVKYKPLHTVKADVTLLKHVMINLLSNAFKYSSKKTEPVVEVDSVGRDGYIIFSVKDNGVGFDENYVHKLFGVFQRLHSDEEFEGTGVGLAIVQRVVERHNGRVWADGKTNEGATFYFSLPNI